MRVHPLFVSSLSIAAAVATAACTDVVGVARDSEFPIQTERSEYTLELRDGWYQVRVRSTYTNTGLSEVYLHRDCGQDGPPTQNLRPVPGDGMAIGLGTNTCLIGSLPLPIRVDPGESHESEEVFSGHNAWPENEPIAKGSRLGHYRVVYLVFQTDTGGLLPLAGRISNPFELLPPR